MSSTLLLLLGLLVAIVFAVILVVNRSTARKKITKRVAALSSLHGEEIEEEASLFRTLTASAGAKGLQGLKQRLSEVLAPAGGFSAARLLVLMGALAVGLVALACYKLLGMSMTLAFLIAVPAGVVAPIYYVRGLVEKRRQAFLDAFPDAIDLIVRAIRAGIPTSESIRAAGTELPQPLGGEFARIAEEMAIGVNIEQAFHEAALRIRLPDFNFFAVTLILQRETGGNLAETLENLSGLLRKRREMRMKVRALTAEGRFTSKVIAGLPVLVMFALYFLNKEYITLLFTDSLGQIFLGAATGLIVVGSTVLNRMVDLEV